MKMPYTDLNPQPHTIPRNSTSDHEIAFEFIN